MEVQLATVVEWKIDKPFNTLTQSFQQVLNVDGSLCTGIIEKIND